MLQETLLCLLILYYPISFHAYTNPYTEPNPHPTACPSN